MATDLRGGVSQPATDQLVARTRDLTRRFGARTVLDRVDLDLVYGEFVGLLGHSGCGKTTLLRILAGLDRDIEGDVETAANRAVVFQTPRLLLWKRVWRNVALALPDRLPAAQRGRAAVIERLAEVGLADRADAWPRTLSGGEAQRVGLARALAGAPDLLLLDEPFAALDALTRARAQQLVAQVWLRHGMSVLLVTHDVDEALLLCDRVLVMRDGTVGHDVPITLDRPRDPAEAQYQRLRAGLLGHLGVAPPQSTTGPPLDEELT